ncbi:PASTA domain-containing protein [Pseudonocardia sp. CA-107938]|uniref:PASTA domain-containing protein n=1 Tax=Pseudonocardia sp. CA-107938 TaxID=3240021 RepID=UPI003D9428C0
MGAGQWREARRAWKRLGTWLDDRVTGPGSRDREPEPLDALGDVGQVRRLLDEVELRAVRCARQRGRSWAEIATRLGVTRQSAWEKWRDLDESPAGPVERATEELWSAAEREVGRLRRSKRVRVPNVVGLAVLDARRTLTDLGLVAVAGDPESVLEMAPASAVVTDQSPESGANVPPGTRVLLWVDRGEGGVREPRRPRPDPLEARKYLPDPADEAVG